MMKEMKTVMLKERKNKYYNVPVLNWSFCYTLTIEMTKINVR